MKRNLYLLGFMVLALASCDKVKDAVKNATKISQDVSLDGQPYTLPTIPAGVTFPRDTMLSALAFPTGTQQFITDNKVDPNAIDSVTVRNMKVTITAPPGETFDFLNRIDLYMATNRDGTDTVRIVSTDVVDHSATSLTLDVSNNTNLKPYLLKDTIYVSVRANFIKAPMDSTVINISGTMHMTASILN